MNNAKPSAEQLRTHILITVIIALRQIAGVLLTFQLLLLVLMGVVYVVDRPKLADPTIFVMVYTATLTLFLVISAGVALTNHDLIRFYGWRTFLRYLMLTAENGFWRSLTQLSVASEKIPPYLRSRRIVLLRLRAWRQRVAATKRLFVLVKPYKIQQLAGDEDALAELEGVEPEIAQIEQEQEEMRAMLLSLSPISLTDRFTAMIYALRVTESKFIAPLFRPH